MIAIRDAWAEQAKINAFRVLTGLVILTQVILTTIQSASYYDATGGMHYPSEMWVSVGMVLLVTGWTLGILTPLLTLLLLVTYLPYCAMHGIFHLGASVFCILLVLFFLCNAGARYSVDALLLAHPSRRVHQPVRWLYSLLGFPDERQLRWVYTAGFSIFALINLAAFCLHLSDPVWMAGDTLACLLLNSFLSRFYGFFRSLDEHWPWLLSSLSFFGVACQTVFQAGMLPLMAVRSGRWFVVGWGLLFFIASLTLLQLSYLAWMELFLWGILFLPVSPPDKIQIVFDDTCGFCHRSRRIFQALDPLHHYAWLPLSAHPDFFHGLSDSASDPQREMHGLYRGVVYKGYDLYTLMSRVNPLLWLLFPLVWLGKITGAGSRVYRFIAARRQAISQACGLQPAPAVPAYQPDWRLATVHRALLGIILLANLGFLSNFTLYLTGAFWSPALAEVLAQAGYTYQNASNASNIALGDVWVVLTRKVGSGPEELVPLNGPDGERLAYLQSDLILYGPTLQWRVGAKQHQDMLPRCCAPGQPGFLWLNRVARFDYRYQHLSGDVTYYARVFANQTSDLSLKGMPALRFLSVPVLQVAFTLTETGVNTP